MKLKLSNILQIIAAVFAVLAIVCLFLPGVTIGNPQEIFGENTTGSISLIGLMFGSGPFKITFTDQSHVINYSGAMSIFGLFAFLLLIAAIILVIGAFIIKKTNLLIFAGTIAIVAGIFALLVKVAGTNINGGSFTSFMNNFDFRLGIGTILFAISTVLGGGLLVLSKTIKTK